MNFLRQTALIICALPGLIMPLSAQIQVTDSLKRILSHTSDPGNRVQLLLDLKDLNEGSDLDLPYSIQLFREADAIGDTYAMSVAIVPIVNRYAAYDEKEDSLKYYIRTLRQMTPGTSEEGIDDYTEMAICCLQLADEYDRERTLVKAHQTLVWCDRLSDSCSNIYERAKRLTLRGYAQMQITYLETGVTSPHISQIPVWEEAYRLVSGIPNTEIRKVFAEIIYLLLSTGYNQANRFDDQQKLIRNYLALLDEYYAGCRPQRRRTYLYAGDSYIMPYQQLMKGAMNYGRNDLAKSYFDEFRARMLKASGTDLLRNRISVYTVAYMMNAAMDQNELAVAYCDSLIRHATSIQKYVSLPSGKLQGIRHHLSRLLYRTGNYEDSYACFRITSRMLDSLFAAEHGERVETIRRSHDMDRLKLAETRAKIRNRTMVIITFAAIGLLMVGVGFYLYRALLHNRALQRDILRHSRKAQESEHMKSTFVNTICRGIGPPLDAIGQSAQQLMVAGVNAPKRHEHLEAIRTNTELLLSTLDNMLEAANLESLTSQLHLEDVDIDEACRAELLSASRLHQASGVEYIIETPGTRCLVQTHAKYFSFVVRALLDNASKFTREGSITLRYEVTADGQLRVSVSDTGCGIPPERREEIFRPLYEHIVASRGLSLSLCCSIAEHLSGSLSLDDSYTCGARFVFTIPAKS